MQDGKSNIWSIEPKMEVEKTESNDGAKANLVVGAAAIGAAIACLPLFSLFSKMLPGNDLSPILLFSTIYLFCDSILNFPKHHFFH